MDQLQKKNQKKKFYNDSEMEVEHNAQPQQPQQQIVNSNFQQIRKNQNNQVILHPQLSEQQKQQQLLQQQQYNNPQQLVQSLQQQNQQQQQQLYSQFKQQPQFNPYQLQLQQQQNLQQFQKQPQEYQQQLQQQFQQQPQYSPQQQQLEQQQKQQQQPHQQQQLQQSPSQKKYPKIECKQHQSELIQMLCFEINCQEQTRLLCMTCMSKSLHLSHMDKVKPFQDIFENNNNNSNSNTYLNIDPNGPLLQNIPQNQNQNLKQDVEAIHNQFQGIFDYLNQRYKDVMKEKLLLVNECNSEIDQAQENSKNQINSVFSVNQLSELFYEYQRYNQSEEYRLKIEQSMLKLAQNYNNKELLESLQPKSNLIVNMDKFKECQTYFEQGFKLLQQSVIKINPQKIQFKPSNFEQSKKYIKISNNGSCITSRKTDQTSLALTTKPLRNDGEVRIQCEIKDQNVNKGQCWGVVLISEQHINQNHSLCWPTKETGIYCCFDGDCYNSVNSTIDNGGTSHKLNHHSFIITFNKSERWFTIESQNLTFKQTIPTPRHINPDLNYYLGFVIQNCEIQTAFI